jgi:hypothetical protein
MENAEFSHRELHLYPEKFPLDYCNKAPISLTSCPYEALRPSGLSSNIQLRRSAQSKAPCAFFMQRLLLMLVVEFQNRCWQYNTLEVADRLPQGSACL